MSEKIKENVLEDALVEIRKLVEEPLYKYVQYSPIYLNKIKKIVDSALDWFEKDLDNVED